MSELTPFYPQLSKTIKINQFKIVDVKINLFESAEFRVLLYDINNNLCDSRFYQLTKEEYLLWGADDTYLTKYAKKKLEQESNNNS